MSEANGPNISTPSNSLRPGSRRGALASFLDRAVDWFIPERLREDRINAQRVSVYVVAHLTGVAFALILSAFLYVAVPAAGRDLAWLTPLYVGIGALPILLRLVPRLEVMATVSSQLFAFAVLVTAYIFGGLLSPAMPWLFSAFATTFYYLGPWPKWRNANVAAQLGQVAIFFFAVSSRDVQSLQFEADSLIGITVVSAMAVCAQISIFALHIWSLSIAKQRELEREIAVRKAAQAEQRRTETELRHSRDHLEQSQRVGRIGSCEITYHDNGVTEARWSAGMFELFGLDSATAHAPDSEEFLALIHPDDRDEVRARREREARGGPRRPTEFRIIRPDGSVRWLRRVAAPIDDGTYKRKPIIVIVFDITEQKEAESALSLLEDMLVQSQKMEAIGKLTGGIAHDFNNLLGVILGMLRLIEDELSETDEPNISDIKQWLGACVRAVDRGTTLTKGMLAFSRRQPLVPALVDLNVILDDTLEMLRRSLGGAYQLDVVKHPSLWPTEADVGQLQNALLNLVLNARDAVPEGGTLTIETRNVHLGADHVATDIDVVIGDYVELSVTDTGVGMDPEVLKRAFDPFFTTKEAGKGIGLGLSMVYGFVKQSGGHVTIDSAVGKGTTVRIFLPRSHGKPGQRPMPEQHVPATIAGETVVLVDDNDDFRYVTRRQIERMGCTVFDAADAEGGLELLRAYPEAHLLVSDVVLPNGVSGVDLAEQAIAELPDLGVVFMSGYNEEHQAFDRIRGRMQIRLLQKPFQPQELEEQIRAALH